jgi:hypothetical protein
LGYGVLGKGFDSNLPGVETRHALELWELSADVHELKLSLKLFEHGSDHRLVLRRVHTARTANTRERSREIA